MCYIWKIEILFCWRKCQTYYISTQFETYSKFQIRHLVSRILECCIVLFDSFYFIGDHLRFSWEWVCLLPIYQETRKPFDVLMWELYETFTPCTGHNSFIRRKKHYLEDFVELEGIDFRLKSIYFVKNVDLEKKIDLWTGDCLF